MSTVESSANQERQQRKVKYVGSASTPIYGIGLIGALVYYLPHATTFVAGLIAFLKAIVWPAMLVYKLFEFLKM
jgi:hypothetical protein